MNLAVYIPNTSLMRLGTSVTIIEGKRRDYVQLDVRFYDSQKEVVKIDIPDDKLRIVFGVKVKGQYDSALILAATTEAWTIPDDEDEDPVYSCRPRLSSAELTELFDEPETEPSGVTLMGEFTWWNVDLPDDPQSTKDIVVVVNNDIVRGDEGLPEDALPLYPLAPDADTVALGASDDGLSWVQRTSAQLWAKFIANVSLTFPWARITKDPYDMGATSGTDGIDFTNGPYQRCYITGDWTPTGITGGDKGDKLELEIQWSTDGHLMDLSAVKLTPAQEATMPAVLESYKCVLLTFHHMGGGWCLVGVTGSYNESED